MLLNIIIFISIIAFDRVTKLLVLARLKPIGSVALIQDVFHFTYSENTGAAFSIFSGNAVALGIFSLAVSFIGLIFLINQKKKNPCKKLYLISIVMILAGAVGNAADRFLYGFVVDFLDFRLINFAVFNIADSFITIGAAIMILSILFDREINL